MHVWMLTGDNGSTAKSVAIKCGIFSDIPIVEIDSLKSRDIPLEPYQVIINGTFIQPNFNQILIHAHSVVVYRCQPSQKAQVVEMIRQNTKKDTLAIGDGANDIHMI